MIAERVRRCRAAHKLTQKELARRLGVSERVVQAWEAGSRRPGLRSQRALAELFDRQPAYFKERL